MISPISPNKKLKMHFKNILYLVHGMKVHGVFSSWVHHFIEKCVYGAGFPQFFPAGCKWLKWNEKYIYLKTINQLIQHSSWSSVDIPIVSHTGWSFVWSIFNHLSVPTPKSKYFCSLDLPGFSFQFTNSFSGVRGVPWIQSSTSLPCTTDPMIKTKQKSRLTVSRLHYAF